MSPPLAGITVVAVEQAIAAPLATRHLVDLGARVLKVEHPDGGDLARHYDATCGGESAYFVWANRGKDSIALDYTTADGRDLLDALIAGADVFVQNLSLGAAERAGLCADHLVARHPTLIACDVSGYGPGGLRSHDKAYDLAIQCEAGVVQLTGSVEQPSKVGISIADVSSAMYALSSILAALYRRDRTGEGAAISISMLECLVEWASPQILTTVATGVAPERSARRHPMIAPYGIFELSNGESVLIAVQTDRDWVTLATEVLDRPDLATDPRFATNPARVAHIDPLEAEIREILAVVPPGVVRERLDRSRITTAAVRDPLEVWEHEQLGDRRRRVTATTSSGSVEVFKAPFNLGGVDDSGGAVPALGDHDPLLIERLVGRGRSAHRSP